jgi:hypothetical protein
MHPRTLLNEVLAERFGDTGDADVLAAPVSDNELVLVDDELRALAREGQSAIERAVRKITDGRRTYVLDQRRMPPRPAGARSPRQPVSTLRVTREATMAAFLAHYVQEDPADRWRIRAFRAEVLGQPSMSVGAAARWIRREASHATANAPAGTTRPDRVRLLAYVTSQNAWVQRVVAAPGTSLDRLRTIADDVATFCGWAQARATMFVLTGQWPETPAIAGRVEWKSPLAARSRIVLTIDPSCPPREVTAAYRGLRKKHFRRIRRLTPPHARLAVFAQQYGHLPVVEQMAQWNAGPGARRRYRKPALFERACRQAVARLTELRTDFAV